ncbi:hypothetical protein [Hymenobacter lucidus]|uniref:Uncharacterized protein n=1 Tax=Hymenobacter lucidus TaxID=2880930 RepID=A0ABS8AYY6_9BACT|nr:hypothetical protein [Hymenobacter lucidus]MCB2411019.1 hypothetical protein [Hymenobacter lucidus]
MPREPHALVAVLHQVQTGLSDPQHHYLVCTNYFQTESGPVLLGTLHLHQSTVWQLEIGTKDFNCEVLLDAGALGHHSPIRVSYDQVWQVMKGAGPQFDAENEEDILYENTSALSAFAQQGLPE